MSRYRKIDVRIHGDAKFLELSPPQPCGRYLWIYLLTCSETGVIPGLYRAGEAGMAEALGWPLRSFRRTFGEIVTRKMAQADWKHRTIWVPRAILYNRPESPNVIRSWRYAWDEIPECPLKEAARIALRDAFAEQGPAFSRAFEEISGKTPGKPSPKPSGEPPGKPSRKPFPNPLSNPSLKAMANQEQEQEQEQEDEGSRVLYLQQSACRSAPSPGRLFGFPEWEGQIAAVWQEAKGAPPDRLKLLRALDPLRGRVPAEQVCAYLRHYLANVEPRFHSLSRFCETFNDHAPDARASPAGDEMWLVTDETKRQHRENLREWKALQAAKAAKKNGSAP